jgi:hypothetical protein
VTVASPTLSQGLNINAAVLLIPYLIRSRIPIRGEELSNVAGRAGRAFVDAEGLVLHVIYNKRQKRLRDWRNLVASSKSRTLSSGLIQIVAEILKRLARDGVLTRDDALEYLANSLDAWKSTNDDGGDQEPLSHLVEKLDTTVFGLIEALDAESADLPRLLDRALQGSLWARQIGRLPEKTKEMYKATLEARAHIIWSQTTPAMRKGHFAMGVGLEAGLALDAMAEELYAFIDRADIASLNGDEDELFEALVELACRLLVIRPFVPNKKNALLANWGDMLKAWVTGAEVNAIGPDNMPVVEDAFTYRLVWALEALRTRRVTLGWSPDHVAGGGAASLETGVPQYMMCMLIRAGLPSRQAAIIAIREGDALFVDGEGMRQWLESNKIATFTDAGHWPTFETAALWKRFRDNVLSEGIEKWRTQNSKRVLDLGIGGTRPPNGIYRVEIDEPQGDVWVCTPDYRRLVLLKTQISDPKPSFLTASFVEGDNRAQIQRLGRDRAIWFNKEP